MNPKISIIVPIWGVEKYLRECVDSILAQTFKDIEVILVDDGSPDGCPTIVDEYAAKDARVVAIHQPNAGYGRAVNHGIERARGDYLGIIESDDWIEPNMYEILLKKMEETQADFVKCGFWKYNSHESPHRVNIPWRDDCDLSKPPSDVFTMDEWPALFLRHCSIWAALYRTDFIRGQKFSETKSATYEDIPFFCELLCRAKRIAVVPTPLVHYRMENEQGSSSLTLDARVLIYPDRYLQRKAILEKYGKFEKFEEPFYYYSSFTLPMLRTMPNAYRRAFFDKMRNVFSTASENFKATYFSKAEKRTLKHLMANHFYRTFLSLLSLRDLRRMTISLGIKKKGFYIRLFGLLIATKNFANRPGFWKIIIGT